MNNQAMNLRPTSLQSIEIASRAAWPALQEEKLPFGVLRFAEGVSRRANSMNMHVDAIPDCEQIRAVTESFYSRYRLPAIVRVLAGNAFCAESCKKLDGFLAMHGYEVMTPTKVMCLDLKGPRLFPIEREMLLAEKVDLQTWLGVWHQLAQKPDSEFNTHRAMLARILAPHCFLVLRDKSGKPVSCGLAVMTGDLIGLFGIATGAAYRGNGFATHLVQQLLSWGCRQAARSAYLQVEEVNAPALAVYLKLGFAERYSYWYREKQFI